jgi:hypothetical protein
MRLFYEVKVEGATQERSALCTLAVSGDRNDRGWVELSRYLSSVLFVLGGNCNLISPVRWCNPTARASLFPAQEKKVYALEKKAGCCVVVG